MSAIRASPLASVVTVKVAPSAAVVTVTVAPASGSSPAVSARGTLDTLRAGFAGSCAAGAGGSYANAKRNGMRAFTGLPSRVAGANTSCFAAASAASSNSWPADVATTASATLPSSSTVSVSTTVARSAVAFFDSG